MIQIDWGKTCLAFLLLITIAFSSSAFTANEPFEIGDIRVAPGEQRSGYLTVSEKDDPGCFIPVTVINGTKKGERIGYLTDYLGNLRQELHAPFSGIMLYIINTPPANKGEPLFEVGRIKKD